jgi:hypothetical protein
MELYPLATTMKLKLLVRRCVVLVLLSVALCPEARLHEL